ncbi:28S ribosomal protein S10, mitochondrial [Tetranychus urticae]|uniref:28S ribosomal protein S10, mitochondrial n=1 Tax=Tetranychus urticae TaxID=32264 RepID=UPI00077BA2FF|nr:28S ribosomal protein S10, mitochondrial [Tetranychus urticae]
MSYLVGRSNLSCFFRLALKPRLLSGNTNFMSTDANKVASADKTDETEDLDVLYKKIELKLQAHDPPVLQSYKKFVLTVSEELGIPVVKAEEPWRHIQRRPLLKSRFIYKDHRAVYEFRTYFLNMQFKHLTGSTADTFLEYIERNLPEGVHLEVVKTALSKMPDHINAKEALAAATE